MHKNYDNKKTLLAAFKTKQTALGYVLATCMSATMLSACSSDDQTSADTAQATQEDTASLVRPVLVHTVAMHQQKQASQYSGEVKADTQANVSLKVAGEVQKVFVNVGDYVKKGTRLVQLDRTDYQVSKAQAQAQTQNVAANVTQAKAQFNTAQAQYLRSKSLYETNTISTQAFEQSRNSFLSAKAVLKAAEQQLQGAQKQQQSVANKLRYTSLVAPFSGFVSAVHVQTNEQVAAGQPIVVMSSQQANEIQVSVPASAISGITKDTKAVVDFAPALSKPVSAQVSEIGYSTNAAGIYPVTVQLQTDAQTQKQLQETIRPGMIAKVSFTAKKSVAVVRVPVSAVGSDKDGNFVYVLKPTAKKSTDTQASANSQQVFTLHRQTVKLGNMATEGFTVLDGLSTNDVIAKAGLNMLQAGDVVRIYQP